MHKFSRWFFSEVFKPLTRRCGTMAGTAILSLGATTELAGQVEIVVPALCGLLLDLMLSHFERKGSQ